MEFDALAVDTRMVFLLPSASSSSAGRNEIKGEDCLRGAAPSSAAPPLRTSSAEHPAQPVDAAGAPSSWALLLGKTRRSASPAGETRHVSNLRRQRSQTTKALKMHHSGENRRLLATQFVELLCRQYPDRLASNRTHADVGGKTLSQADIGRSVITDNPMLFSGGKIPCHLRLCIDIRYQCSALIR